MTRDEAPCSDNENPAMAQTQEPPAQPKTEKTKRPGQGRNGAASYTGATRVKIPHERLTVGEICELCLRGKLYPFGASMLVRVTGMAPLHATVYELERLRCNTCGEVFTAKAPEGVGEEKYDESASAMIGMLKCGTGVPFLPARAARGRARYPDARLHAVGPHREGPLGFSSQRSTSFCASPPWETCCTTTTRQYKSSSSSES